MDRTSLIDVVLLVALCMGLKYSAEVPVNVSRWPLIMFEYRPALLFAPRSAADNNKKVGEVCLTAVVAINVILSDRPTDRAVEFSAAVPTVAAPPLITTTVNTNKP